MATNICIIPWRIGQSPNIMTFHPRFPYRHSMVRNLGLIESARAVVEVLPLPPDRALWLRQAARQRATRKSTRIEGNTLNSTEVGQAVAADMKAHYDNLQMGLPVDFYEGRHDPDHTQWLEYFLGTMAKAAEELRQQAIGFYAPERRPVPPWERLQRVQQQLLARLLTRCIAEGSASFVFVPGDIEEWFGVSGNTALDWLKKWRSADFITPAKLESRRIRAYALSQEWTDLLRMALGSAGNKTGQKTLWDGLHNRNKALQQMFLMIGGGERAGSGADRIRSGWRAQHWRAPKIEVREEPDRVRLTLPMVSLIPAETLDRLRGVFGSDVDSLAPAELQALATADLEGAVSNTRLQQLLADHPVDITRMLTRLCDRGLLVSDNRRRWTIYRLGRGEVAVSLFHKPPANASEESIRTGGDSSHLTGDSSHLAEDSGHPRGDSDHPRDDSGALREIAKPVASRGKVPVAQMRETIVQLCTGRHLTSEQLAGLLGRASANLRARYLTPMVAEGSLRLRYPSSSNRPDQAYTAAEKG